MAKGGVKTEEAEMSLVTVIEHLGQLVQMYKEEENALKRVKELEGILSDVNYAFCSFKDEVESVLYEF